MSKKGVTILYIPQKPGKRSVQIEISYIMTVLILSVLLMSFVGLFFLVWESTEVPNTSEILNETLELGQQKRELEESIQILERRISLLEIYALQAKKEESGGPLQFVHQTHADLPPWKDLLLVPVQNAHRIKGYIEKKKQDLIPHEHQGIDYFAVQGTVVSAAHDGLVQKVLENDVLGHHILLAHVNGCSTLYAHLSEGFVSEGEWVYSGASIGLVGDSGQTDGSHLHFEFICDGRAINPHPYLFTP